LNKKLKLAKIFFINFFLIILLFFSLEFLFRYKEIINFNGIEKDFIVKTKDFHFENNKNYDGKVFGIKSYTDENGFRIENNQFKYKKFSENILILGDSTSFGVGIEEPETFVGLLRKKYQNKNFYNSSVVGYHLYNYSIVIDNFFRKNYAKKITIFLNINDLHFFEAFEANSELEVSYMKRLIGTLNSFLRDKLLIYVYFKGLASNPPKRYYDALFSMYKNENLLLAKKYLSEIKYKSNQFKSEILVVLLPYSFQVTEGKCSDFFLFPQNKLKNILSDVNISYMDLTDSFCENKNAIELFFKFDPVHLSKKGHQHVFKKLVNDRIF